MGSAWKEPMGSKAASLMRWMQHAKLSTHAQAHNACYPSLPPSPQDTQGLTKNPIDDGTERSLLLLLPNVAARLVVEFRNTGIGKACGQDSVASTQTTRAIRPRESRVRREDPKDLRGRVRYPSLGALAWTGVACVSRCGV